MDIFPNDIRQADDTTLEIDWSDGVQSKYNVFNLRTACPCANCIDELTGKLLLDPENIDPNVKPKGLVSVGNYAIQIAWSDGHDTGIYTWKRLRALADAGLA